MQRPVVAEFLVEGALEVVTVARTGLQEPEKGVPDRHALTVHPVYTHNV
jgi:hypothetical protein